MTYKIENLFSNPNSFILLLQVENRALRLREVATAMQQYQDESQPSTASVHYNSYNSARIEHMQPQDLINALADEPGKVLIIHSGPGVSARVGGLSLNGIEETSRAQGSSVGTGNSALAAPSTRNGDWEYFDEVGYIKGGALHVGEDPYIRNRFNQEASDALPSNREIPDTRNPM